MIRGARIAQLIESDGPGGAERTAVNLASVLQDEGCYSLLILPARGEGWLGREAAAAGLPTEYFDLDHPISPRGAQWLEQTFRKHRITLAHSHEFTMTVYSAWAAWRAGIGHVATMHGSRYYAERLRRRLALRAAFTLGGQFVAVSNQLATHLSRDLWIRQTSIRTIPNGVRWNSSACPSVRDELRLGSTDTLILAVGNLYPVKGHQHLIEALARLTERRPNAHVAIAGRGELEDSLRTQAHMLGLEDHVHLLGLRSDIPALLTAADVFALPSISEGLPLALVEAMFAGRPIVASDVGEVRTVLNDGEAGLLVEPGNAEQLARALDGLLSHPDEAKRLGDAAARRAGTDYDVARMVARYAEVYQQLPPHSVRGPA
jgi:glycosyltransferase involved in cell wall biosynthesis